MKSLLLLIAIISTLIPFTANSQYNGKENISAGHIGILPRPGDEEKSNVFSFNLLAGKSKNEYGFSFSTFNQRVYNNANGFQLSGIRYRIDNNGSGVMISGITNKVGNRYNGIQIAGIANTNGAFNGIQISGIANTTADSRSIQIAGISNTSGDQNGLQIAGLVNVNGEMQGVQLSGLTNMTGESGGIQITGLANIAGEFSGFQASGLANISGDGNGVQIVGLANIGGDFNGLQISGFTNILGEGNGTQIAGISNIAGDMRGIQIGGFANIAGDITGAQIGTANIAGWVQGVQIGLFNKARHSDYPIGLINLIENGERTVGITYDETGSILATARTGSKVLYGIFGTGYNHQSKNDKWVLQAGLGTHIPIVKNVRINCELTHQYMTDISKWDTHVSKSSLQILPAYKFNRFELLLGPTLNYMQTDNLSNTSIFPDKNLWNKTTTKHIKQLHIGYTVGIQWHI